MKKSRSLSRHNTKIGQHKRLTKLYVTKWSVLAAFTLVSFCIAVVFMVIAGAAQSWRATSLVNAPSARTNSCSVWTGTEMIVWGGGLSYLPINMSGIQQITNNQGILTTNTGSLYSPTTNSWRPTSQSLAPSGRQQHTCIWTGQTNSTATSNKMIVFGGWDGTSLAGGGTYDPVTDSWQEVSLVGAPSPRHATSIIWTGDTGNVLTSYKAIVFGGWNSPANFAYGDGGMFDPLTNTWQPLGILYDTARVIEGRVGHTAVWDDRNNLMLICGGSGTSFNALGCASYDPASMTWQDISHPAILRWSHVAIWTGTKMLITGGRDNYKVFDDTFVYDPAANQWSQLATSTHAKRSMHIGLWTGTQLVIWGGYDDSFDILNKGMIFDPATNTWIQTVQDGVPSGRVNHTGVWTGTEAIFWGGVSSEGIQNTGGVLTL